jgi:hypothetical protein
MVLFAPLAPASVNNYQLDVKIGDKLTTLTNSTVNIYYIQGVEPGDQRYIVYCTKTNSQYLMDKKYIQKNIYSLERKMATIYTRKQA